jgi:hypothetical protein
MASAARTGHRLALALALVLALTAALPRPAGADGDPASDVLLGVNVFYPYTPPVAGSLQKSLDAETAAAKQAGFPLKVALIESPVDLGVVPDLFGRPQKYADFLDQEISFRTKQPLLVVMAAGYGVQGLGTWAQGVVASLPKPTGRTSNDLARAATVAVARLAGAAGYRIPRVPGVPGGPSAGGGGAAGGGIVPALVALAAVVAAALAVVTVRRRRARAGA